MHRFFVCPTLAFSIFAVASTAQEAAPQKTEPAITYTGTVFPDVSADGGLPLAVGVHNIQVVRGNRTAPEHADKLAHTYLHQPMLAWRKGKFYLEYLSGPQDEHQAPGPASLSTSSDGLRWEKPRMVFPAIELPGGEQSITHQRMGFYVAPNGKLLVLAFHGRAPTPPDGAGIGRVVRELREDGSFGPIHFILYNREAGWNEGNTPYSHFTTSKDKEFVAACEALLANKLMTQQWWEENRQVAGMFSTSGRALSFFHRKDGTAVGIWKTALTATSKDEGRTWSEPQPATNIPRNGSKYWAQQTSDGRYALFFNPTNRLRHPLAVLTSDDGARFDGLLTVHGELPDQRFMGGMKNLGPQYVRGIVEGNGAPPDGATWITYSVNKEDIWVSRVPSPIVSRVKEPVKETFANVAVGEMPPSWNVYSPSWAPVRVVDASGERGRALELRDEEPYDYARAIRVFPSSRHATVRFNILAKQTTGRFEIDVQGPRGERPIRIALNELGRILVCHEGIWLDRAAYNAGEWLSFEISVNPEDDSDRFDVALGGKSILSRPAVFSDPVSEVERISFRTGAYRFRGAGGADLPGADERSAAAVFWIDDVEVSPRTGSAQ